MEILSLLLESFKQLSPEYSPLTHSENITVAIQAILRDLPVTAPANDIIKSLNSIPESIPDDGIQLSQVTKHVLQDLSMGFARGQSGPRYFGFVTGGALPAAQCGDILATVYDQNVQVHLPTDTISTALEHRTLEMILDLLKIPRDIFTGRSLSSGATGSNILGLLCGRDYAIRNAVGDTTYSVADHGYPAGISLKVLTDRHHASIEKAASIVGIGRNNVINVQADNSEEFNVNLASQLDHYRQSGQKIAVIVVVSFGEVNTGDYTGMKNVRTLCDQYGAWLHIDAAFGALACLLPEHAHLSQQMACADSLTLDAHKSFNVPYATGMFYTRQRSLLTSILAGSSLPVYLSTSSQFDLPDHLQWTSTVASPLHLNLENSRRFIALPLYCALVNLGRNGYTELIRRNVEFARDVAHWMSPDQEGGQWYEVLNSRQGEDGSIVVPLNVVLFRPKDSDFIPAVYRRSHYPDNPGSAAAAFIRVINDTKRIYVSPGAYKGGAVRIAVSNWMTGLDDNGKDLEIVKAVLREIMYK